MSRRLWLLIFLALTLTVPFWAQNETEIYRDVSPSVVSIEVAISRFDTAGGAGFVIDADGHIVTNAHVVEDARALTVKFHDGYEAPAALIGMDTRVDLAVIKVDVARHRLKPVTFGDSDVLVVGEAVVAIGSPHGLDATLTRGIISGLNRRLESDDGTVMEGAIQTDAALTGGNSGGPLLNQAGEVIGVNTAGYSGTALGFAVPSNIARRIAERMIVSAIPWATKEAAAAYATYEVAVTTAEALEELYERAQVAFSGALAEYVSYSLEIISSDSRVSNTALTATSRALENQVYEADAIAYEVEATLALVTATVAKAYAVLEVRAPDKAATVSAYLTSAVQRATAIAGATEQRATAQAIATEQRTTSLAKQRSTARHSTMIPAGTRQRATVNAMQTAIAGARVTPTPTPYHVSVDSTVNLRSGPGTNHAVVGVARPGDSFAVIGYQAGSPYNWLEIRYGDGTAWIAESLTQRHR